MFSKLLNNIKLRNNTIKIYSVHAFSTSKTVIQIAKPILRKQSPDNFINPFGWFLLIVPAATFGLGTWQVYRKQWKESLLLDLQNRTSSDPVNLPETIEEINALEYKPVCVKGHFIHDKEMYMGPRSLLHEGDASTKSSLISGNTNSSQGFLVVTPFKLKGRDETILVNRGWVPAKYKDPKTREGGQIKGETTVIGVVRLHENRPNFSIKNQKDSNNWFYRDLRDMAQKANANEIFLDATNDFHVPDGPVGGQTRISLRNEHLSYILTWYSLCGATSFMWYKKFIKKV